MVTEGEPQETPQEPQRTPPEGHAASRPLTWAIAHCVRVRPSGFIFLAAKVFSMGCK